MHVTLLSFAVSVIIVCWVVGMQSLLLRLSECCADFLEYGHNRIHQGAQLLQTDRAMRCENRNQM